MQARKCCMCICWPTSVIHYQFHHRSSCRGLFIPWRISRVRWVSQSGICAFVAVPSVLRRTADVCTCVCTLSMTETDDGRRDDSVTCGIGKPAPCTSSKQLLSNIVCSHSWSKSQLYFSHANIFIPRLQQVISWNDVVGLLFWESGKSIYP